MTKEWHQRPAAWAGSDSIRPEAGLLADIERSISAIASGDPSASTEGWRRSCRVAIHRALEQGSGALAFSSATLESLPQAEFTRVFQAWCRWLGMPVPINLGGDVLKEVKDAGVTDSLVAPQRGHMTNQELAFHSDRADISCLACWSPAASGGEFRVISSAWVARWIAEHHPDLLDPLTRPLPHDLRDEGDGDYTALPIMSESADGFVFRYIRKFNESVVRHGVQVPAEVKHLLDVIDEAADQPGVAAEVVFEKGTVAICNNHTTLHSRNAFHDDDLRQRCLLRCWLASEFTRPLPSAFLPLFHDVRPGVLRGGVRQPG